MQSPAASPQEAKKTLVRHTDFLELYLGILRFGNKLQEFAGEMLSRRACNLPILPRPRAALSLLTALALALVVLGGLRLSPGATEPSRQK